MFKYDNYLSLSVSTMRFQIAQNKKQVPHLPRGVTFPNLNKLYCCKINYF